MFRRSVICKKIMTRLTNDFENSFSVPLKILVKITDLGGFKGHVLKSYNILNI